MGRERGWVTLMTGRASVGSSGRPPVARREHHEEFWEAISEGATSEHAAARAEVSPAVGTRWFREAGGMPPSDFKPHTGRYLSFGERDIIAICRAYGFGIREIARYLGRSPSTISREVRRNAATRSGQLDYRASVAQWHRDVRAARPKESKLDQNPQLRDYVQDRLAGLISTAEGEEIPGPVVRFKGRRHGRRADRRWAKAWSPQQISNRLRVDFPDNDSMRLSHEAIYQALYIDGRSDLERDNVACLRTGRALRRPRARTKQKGKKFIPPEQLIAERPAEVADRSVLGHWEGDLIIGLNRSAIGTLVERSTRYTVLLHLPRMEGHGDLPPVKNGPPLAGHGAEAVRKAIVDAMSSLPDLACRSITWDQGAELAQHEELTQQTGLPIWFCDPHSPWQRGTNENTNGLLRQYFPKGTDLSRHSPEHLDAVAKALNNRPRETLGWRSPAEALDDHLRSLQQAGVATTG